MNVCEEIMESSKTEFHEETKECNSIECRACLQKFDNVINLYNLFEDWPTSWSGMSSTIADDLSRVAQIQIKQEGNFPNLICLECCSTLQRACMFVDFVQSNDLILRQRNPGTSSMCPIDWPRPIQMESLSNYVNIPEIKQEVMSDEEMEINGQVNNEALVEIKVEPEELLQPVHYHYTNGLDCDNSAAITPTINGENFEKIYLEKQVKQEPPSEEEVQPQFEVSLECILCFKKCKSISGLKTHVIAMHSYKGVKRKFDNAPVKRDAKHVCSTCRRSFTTSTDLMVHETCHNKLVCYSCNRNFDTFKQLTRHRKTCKAAVTEVVKPKTLEDVRRTPHEEARLPESQNSEPSIHSDKVLVSKTDRPETLTSDIDDKEIKKEIIEGDTIEESLRKLLGDDSQ